ncbi:hypothetical protein L873DRAFT_1663621 [Choiromyces venosus 120613-1]|uniref:NADH-ubiquinone oxidoreductase 9.5 kDa subunit n=1 Tax=Choiromyces venosus 120613-1 TaxID=1336337 RepID=A0A3N4K3B8_9PEZI|nr:hypothetical protein L873DRAFT_1663621 [Choiromyces venosus 120613-1]
MSTPYFWAQPFRYMRYAAHQHPALFWSVVIGAQGPLIFLGGVVARKKFGWERPTIPLSYPVPNRPRRIPAGYDD